MYGLADSLGMLNSSIQYAGAQMGAVRDKKFIREENQKARDFQIQLWNMANEYNLPSAQMQRLQDAGLNPNLVYGNGANTLAEYASAPGHSAPNMGSGQMFQKAGSALMEGILAKSQLDVNQSAIDLNRANAYKATQEGTKTKEEAGIIGASREDLIKLNKRMAFKLQQDGIISAYQANIMQNQSDFSDYWRETPITYTNSDGEELTAVGWQIDVMKSLEGLRAMELGNNQTIAVLNKLGAETREINKNIEHISEQIKLLKTEEFKNLCEADYYRGAQYLNGVLAVKAGVEAQNLKEMLPFNKFESLMRGVLSGSTMDLNEAQIKSLTIGTYNALLNGELDRYLKGVVQRYGTSNVGNILNILYEGTYNIGHQIYKVGQTIKSWF